MPAPRATATAPPVQLTARTLYAPRVRDEQGRRVIRAIIEYESEPEAERYRKHVEEFASAVECDAFRHGKVFGSPFGDPKYRYYAEFEWADMDSFKAAAGSEAFAATGNDAASMGIPITVHIATV